MILPSSRHRRWPLLAVVVIAVAGLAIAFGNGLSRDPTYTTSALINRSPPELKGRTLHGRNFDLRDLRGHWVLVTIWGSWCPSCRDEHRLLAETARRFGPQGLRMVGINMRDDPSDARDLLPLCAIGTSPKEYRR